jgi:hypothetical protein
MNSVIANSLHEYENGTFSIVSHVSNEHKAQLLRNTIIRENDPFAFNYKITPIAELKSGWYSIRIKVKTIVNA